MALLATAIMLIALLAAPPVARVAGTNGTILGQPARVTGGDIEYFPARFDERSLPAVPQPGQFSLAYGE